MEPTIRPTYFPTTKPTIPTNEPSTEPTLPTAAPTTSFQTSMTVATQETQVTESEDSSFWSSPLGYDLKFVLVGVAAILLCCCVLLFVCFHVRSKHMYQQLEKFRVDQQPSKGDHEAQRHEQISEPGAYVYTLMQDDNIPTLGEERESIEINKNKEMDEGDMEIEDMYNGDSIYDDETPHDPAQEKRNERESIVMHVQDTNKDNKTSISIIGHVRDTDL